MTTYATTYGWRSMGVRRDLVTSPPEQKPVNGGRRGPMEVYGIADPITTNQKVAGSSPAERATKSPANCGVLLLRFTRAKHPIRGQPYWIRAPCNPRRRAALGAATTGRSARRVRRYTRR